MNTTLDRKLYADPVPVATLIQALEEKQKDYTDCVIDSNKFFMDSTTGNMVVKNGAYNYEEHEMQNQALQLLLARLKVPGSYAKRCPSDLLSENVNHWLSRYNKQLFIRYDKQQIRSVLTPRYNVVGNLEMVEKLYQNTEDKDLSVRYEISPTRFIAQFVSFEKHPGSDVGDPCYYGIHLCNSETGHSSAVIKGLIMRLACTNGLISPSVNNSWARTHRSQSELILDEMAESIRTVTSELPEILRAFYKTRDISLNNMEQTVKSISTQYKLSEAQQEEVLKHVEGSNLYSLVNAFTHAGSHQNDLSLIAREELQVVGGKLISMDRTRLERLSA